MIKSARPSCVLSVASDQRSSGRFALQRTVPADPLINDGGVRCSPSSPCTFKDNGKI